MTCCFAENEAESPWAPLHVERGFAAETSTVTAFGGAAPANIIEKSKTATRCSRRSRGPWPSPAPTTCS